MRALRTCIVAALCLFPGSVSWAITQPLPDWLQRFRIGGSAAVRAQNGARDAQGERNSGASVYQAGIAFDVDVAPNWSFWYDIALVREAQDRSTFREQLYIRRDNILDQGWLNVKLGRFFMPFGEDYLRWDQIGNHLASRSVALPWALDEGVLFFGDILPNQKLSYSVSLQNGNDGFNYDENPNKTVALKLMTQPLPWFYASTSFLNLGKQGNATTSGYGEFWLGGFHIEPVETTTAPSGASPSKIVSGHAYEQDIKLSSDLGEAWANFGYFHHIDGGGHQFDRYIRYYSTQLLGYIPKIKKKAYLIGRYSVIETMSATEGYRFAGTEIAIPTIPPATSPYNAYNYNQKDLYRWSFGAGYWFHQNILGKLEYSWEDSHLIESAKTQGNLDFRGHRNFFIAELAIRF